MTSSAKRADGEGIARNAKAVISSSQHPGHCVHFFPCPYDRSSTTPTGLRCSAARLPTFTISPAPSAMFKIKYDTDDIHCQRYIERLSFLGPRNRHAQIF